MAVVDSIAIRTNTLAIWIEENTRLKFYQAHSIADSWMQLAAGTDQCCDHDSVHADLRNCLRPEGVSDALINETSAMIADACTDVRAQSH